MKTYNYHLPAEKVLLESYKKENRSKSRLLCLVVMLAVSIIFCILSFSYGKLQIDLQKNIRSDGMAAWRLFDIRIIKESLKKVRRCTEK